jgi:hypothetical protein
MYRRMTFEAAVEYARTHGADALRRTIENGWHDPDASKRSRLDGFIAAAAAEAGRRGPAPDRPRTGKATFS